MLDIDVGVVLSVTGDSSGPLAARGEFAYNVVPVESPPAGGITLVRDQAKTSDAWKVVAEDSALASAVDIEGVFITLLEFVQSLSWPEVQADTWRAELEAGFAFGIVWLFQIRFDAVDGDCAASVLPQPISFGIERNFPVPVSRLTADFLAPVLSTNFGAPIALDECARQFVCASNSAPPPGFVSTSIRAARRSGLFTLDAVLGSLDQLNEQWRLVAKVRRELASMSPVDALIYARHEFTTHLNWYFSNPLFRRAVGTEYLLEHDDEVTASAGVPSEQNLSSQAAYAFTLGSLRALKSAGPSYVSAYLFGDDSIGTPRLLEKLLARDGDRASYDALLGDYFERSTLFGADMIARLTNDASWTTLSLQQQAMRASLWFQEYDNQYKDALYFAVREALLRFIASYPLSQEEAIELRFDELVSLGARTLTVDECRLRALVRQTVPAVGGGVLSGSDVSQVNFEVPVSFGRAQAPEPGALELFHVQDAGALSDQLEDERARRMYLMPTASSIQCLEIPRVAGLWLYGLGELSHAANVLRSRGEFPFLLFGHANEAARATGRWQVSHKRTSISFQALL